MDFKINTNKGLGEMTFDKAEDIMNNIFLSLMIQRGSWWFNPEFGSRLHLLKRQKLTDRTEAMAKEYCKEALQWLIDMGRAKQVEISTQRETDRLKVLVEVTQVNDKKASFETFVRVV